MVSVPFSSAYFKQAGGLSGASSNPTVTAPTNDRTIAQHVGDILNVKSYGATGDGVTDDTAAIQACLDAAFGVSSNPHDTNQGLNKPVYFPAGGYKITQPLVVTAVRSGKIFGDGMFVSNIVWGGSSSSFVGNQLGTRSGSTDDGTPNNNISCMLEIAGMARSHISDLQFAFSGGGGNQTACVYGYGHKTSTQVVWENVCFASADYGMLLGAGSPNGVSEWKFYNCYFTLNKQAGIYITGQNTLNHNFVNCSVDTNGTAPLTTTFTGAISGSTLTVSAYSSAVNNPYLAAGLIIYSTNGAVQGNTFISSFGTGTGGTGTYALNKTYGSSVAATTMYAFGPYYGGIVNVNGSTPFIAGCDMTGNPWDILDFSANNLTINGIRSESVNFLQFGSGTYANVNACSLLFPTTQSTNCTTNGPILTVNSTPTLAAGAGFAGFGIGNYVSGTDGVNSLPETGLNPPVTTILRQISGVSASTGEYLLSDQPAGALGTFTCAVHPLMSLQIGSGAATLNDCNPHYAVVAGSNNSVLRIRNNGFSTFGSAISSDLLRGYAGQVLEYDVAALSAGNFTIANLPTAAARFKGVRMIVTDSSIAMSNSSNFGAAVGAGGGSNAVPVTCDGTTWRIG